MDNAAIFAPGTLLADGKYRVARMLGRGAYGEVYLVRHLELDEDQALKVLRKDADGVSSSVIARYQARFKLEAQLARKLKANPNTIDVYELGRSGELLFMTMEFAPGGSLKDLLASEGRLPIERVIGLLRDAGSGLLALHETLHVIHRDIKPSNLLLDAAGKLKVADLGLAQTPEDLTLRFAQGSQAQEHPGTPDYMSPEQLHERGPLSSTSDIYSLGCVAFEMLTGQTWVWARQAHEGPRSLRADTPEWLDAVVRRMLREAPGLTVAYASDSSRRYVTIAAMLEDLSAGERRERGARAIREAEAARLKQAVQAALDDERLDDANAALEALLALAPDDPAAQALGRNVTLALIAEKKRLAREAKEAEDKRIAAEATQKAREAKEAEDKRFTAEAAQLALGARRESEAKDLYASGGTWYLKKDYDRAIVDYSKAIVLDPKVANYWYSRGVSYYSKSEYTKALADDTRAIELRPTDGSLYQSRSLDYDKLGDKARAEADRAKARALGYKA